MKKLSNERNKEWYDLTLKTYISYNNILAGEKPLESYCQNLFIHGEI